MVKPVQNTPKSDFICFVCECGKDSPVRRETACNDCPSHEDGVHVYKQMDILQRLERDEKL